MHDLWDDLGHLVIRMTTGALLAGHGAQKLFGWFGGRGFQSTKGWMESMGLKPGDLWAGLAGLSEFGGGLLTPLGLLHPLGPVLSSGSMLMAQTKVHGGKPVWVTSGGGELPVTNLAAALALVLAGPGSFSLERVLGIRLPRWLALPGYAAVIAGVVAGMRVSAPPAAPVEVAAAELQAVEEAAHPV
jgi:putative oxidoreductase